MTKKNGEQQYSGVKTAETNCGKNLKEKRARRKEPVQIATNETDATWICPGCARECVDQG